MLFLVVVVHTQFMTSILWPFDTGKTFWTSVVERPFNGTVGCGASGRIICRQLFFSYRIAVCKTPILPYSFFLLLIEFCYIPYFDWCMQFFVLNYFHCDSPCCRSPPSKIKWSIPNRGRQHIRLHVFTDS